MYTTSKNYLITQGLVLITLISILALGLLPAFIAGLLVYFIVEFGAQRLERIGVIPKMGKLILLAVVAIITTSGVTMGVLSSVSYVSEGPESIVVLFQRMADIVNTARDYLPLWVHKFLPRNIDEWQQTAADWLRANAGYFSLFGKEIGIFLVHIVIGMIIGGMIAINPALQTINGPLGQGISDRVEMFSISFRRIAFSQIRISALNTFLTGTFLLIVLPLLGSPLPLTKTMIVVTFIAGLLPIVGNLISNTVIFLIALSVSPITAIGALIFLIVIHKLEYFFNAHIIGTQIKSRAWEILLSMLVFETIFGIAGLIAAPIYYAYIKDELTKQRLI